MHITCICKISAEFDTQGRASTYHPFVKDDVFQRPFVSTISRFLYMMTLIDVHFVAMLADTWKISHSPRRCAKTTRSFKEISV